MGIRQHPESLVNLLAALAVLCGLCAAPPRAAADHTTAADPPPRVAHAGGGVRHRAMTNSLEALDQCLADGYRLVELDFSWTTDDRLVLIHDWYYAPHSLFAVAPGRLTHAEFEALRSPWGITQLTLEDLGAWLRTHHDIDVVTDVKGRNLEGLRRIVAALPDLRTRLVAQIHDPAELPHVRSLGIERQILTLYAGSLTDDEVVAFATENRPYAVTMPVQRARSDLPRRLRAAGVFSYAHPVDDYRTWRELESFGLGGIYTNWLSPIDPLAERVRDPNAEPLPEWTVGGWGPTALEVPVLAFVGPTQDGFSAGLWLGNGAPSARIARIVQRDQAGEVSDRRALNLTPGERRWVNLPLQLVASLYLETGPGVIVDPEWRYGDVALAWNVVRVAYDNIVVGGSGRDLGGHLVFVLNPTDETQVFRIERSVGGVDVFGEHMVVRPGGFGVQVFESRTEDRIEVRVTGGPMVVQTLRWDAHRRMMLAEPMQPPMAAPR